MPVSTKAVEETIAMHGNGKTTLSVGYETSPAGRSGRCIFIAVGAIAGGLSCERRSCSPQQSYNAVQEERMQGFVTAFAKILVYTTPMVMILR